MLLTKRVSKYGLSLIESALWLLGVVALGKGVRSKVC